MSRGSVKPQQGMVIVEQCQCGGERNLGYILAEGPAASAWVIDPGPDPRSLIQHLVRERYVLEGIISSRHHPHQTAGIDALVSLYDVPVIGHLANPRADEVVHDGEEIFWAGRPLRFLHTPGFTADSLCVLFDGHLFTGGTLLAGRVGDTTSPETALAQYESLQRLMELDDGVMVWPGYDCGIVSHSTMGEEKRSNPYLLCRGDLTEFLRLKAGGPVSKPVHGSE